MDAVKEKIVKSPDLNSSRSAQLALRDSALLLAYCYKNFDEIVEFDEDLDKLFK